MEILVAGAALLADQAAGLWQYNQANWQWDEQQRQNCLHQRQNMLIQEAQVYREDLRDLFGLVVSKTSTYMTVSTLVLGFCISLFFDGLLPKGTPSWLHTMHAATLASSFAFVILSLAYCVHATVHAQTSAVRTLTQRQRLPIPTEDEVEGASSEGLKFERELFRTVWRIPFLQRTEPDRPHLRHEALKLVGHWRLGDDGARFEVHKDQEDSFHLQLRFSSGLIATGQLSRSIENTWQAALMIGRKHGQAAGSFRIRLLDPKVAMTNVCPAGSKDWGPDVLAQKDTMLAQEHGVRLVQGHLRDDHFQLYKKLQKSWNHFASYAKVSLTFGAYHLLQNMVYFAFAVMGGDLGAAFVTATYASCFLLIMLGLLHLDVHMKLLETCLAFLLVPAGPAVSFFYLSTDGRRDYLDDDDQVLGGAAPAIIAMLHLFQLLFLLWLVEPFDFGALPTRFITVRETEVSGWFGDQEEQSQRKNLEKKGEGLTVTESKLRRWLTLFESPVLREQGYLNQEQVALVGRLREAFGSVTGWTTEEGSERWPSKAPSKKLVSSSHEIYRPEMLRGGSKASGSESLPPPVSPCAGASSLEASRSKLDLSARRLRSVTRSKSLLGPAIVPEEEGWVCLHCWSPTGKPSPFWANVNSAGLCRRTPPPGSHERPPPSLLELTHTIVLYLESLRASSGPLSEEAAKSLRMLTEAGIDMRRQRGPTDPSRGGPLTLERGNTFPHEEEDHNQLALNLFWLVCLCLVAMWLVAAVVLFFGRNFLLSDCMTSGARRRHHRPRPGSAAALVGRRMTDSLEDLEVFVLQSAEQRAESVATTLLLYCSRLSGAVHIRSQEAATSLAERLRAEADLGDGFLSAYEMRLWLSRVGSFC